MKNKIFITTHDKDYFFTYGLKMMMKDNHIIKKYSQKNLNHQDKNNYYDINSKDRIEITVYPSKDEISRTLVPCLRNGMCIFKKDQTIEDTLAVIENAVYQLREDAAPAGYCKKCEIIELTTIEKKILLGISEMLSQGEIASTLRLPLKFVSRHKRNAMEKLSLHNNTELKIYLLKHVKSVSKKGKLILSL